MTAFLWAMIAIFIIEIACKLALMAAGKFSPPTPITYALDTAVNTGLLLWAALLLARM